MSVIPGPKGTRDFYPELMSVREHIFASWQSTCKRYGFESYDGPMFEHLELYTQKSGDEIEKQLYTFDDKGGRHLALRPELTPTLARMVAAKGTNLKRPVRWYSIPRLFRYEKMQKGRLREFFQLNMDILGIKETCADAELIAAVIDMMFDLGFSSDDFSVHISSRNLLEELFLFAGIAPEKLLPMYALLDKKHKIPPEVFTAELSGIAETATTQDTVERILAIKTLDDAASIHPDSTALKDLIDIFSLLGHYNMTDVIEFDIGIVRGLAYYTGTVFEVFDKKRTLRAIAGGGRYDKLVKLYGGPDTPAVGFAAGDVVLGELLKDKNCMPQQLPRSDVFIVSFDHSNPGYAIETAHIIRKAGISCEFSLKNTAVGKQLEMANAARSRVVVFVGGSEEQQGHLKIKHMHSGTETTIAKSMLLETLHSFGIAG